jgi:hypothetical protein
MVMKKILLSCLIVAAAALTQAQTLQLPGTGSNQVNIHAAQLNTATQLGFGNPEYAVVGFTVNFPTNSNPDYSATSTNDHFTTEMLTNWQQRTPGSNLNLLVTLQAPGTGHQPWNKSYVITVGD